MKKFILICFLPLTMLGQNLTDSSVADITISKANKHIIMKSSAHYKKGISKIEGKLYLSANKLEFKTLMISLRTEKFDINLEDISSVSLAWTKFFGLFPLLPNSILIKTKNDKSYKFTVKKSKKWISSINNLIDK
tara:strand:- start:359 stop:763 length:405 start_codon:yes stop_codon:yes gene_type:complete